MENINDILKNQGGENNQPSTAGGQNPVPQNTGYQNPVMTSTGYKNPTQPAGGYISPKPPKKDNKKLIALVAIIAAVAVVIVTVIGAFALGSKPQENLNNTTFTNANTNQSTEPTTETATETTMQGTSTTEVTTAPEGGWAKADISEIAKNIEIDGKKISLPCTVGEMANMLGEEWELLYSEEVLKNNATTECKFIKGTEHILGFNLKEYNPNIPFEDHIIDSFTIFTDAFSGVSLNWINKNTTLEEIESRYGRLHSVNNNMDKNPDVHNILRLYDINSESEVIILDYFKGSLYSITI